MITTLEQRRQIQERTDLGQKSPEIAAALKISVWTVRKWKQRLKKGALLHLKWVDQKEDRCQALMSNFVTILNQSV